MSSPGRRLKRAHRLMNRRLLDGDAGEWRNPVQLRTFVNLVVHDHRVDKETKDAARQLLRGELL